MLRTAARLWGVDEPDVKMLDPLVDRLIEAFARQFFSLNQHFKSLQANRLEKLADLMLPEVDIAPRPSSSIIYAPPSVPRHTLSGVRKDDYFSFLHQMYDPQQDTESQIEIHFSPVGEVPLFDARIEYLVQRNQIFKPGLSLKKQALPSQLAVSVPYGDIWLGISFNPSITTLDGLSIYFDLEGLAGEKNRQLLYEYVKNASWWVGNKEISFQPHASFLDTNDPGEKLKFLFNPAARRDWEIMAYYSDRFMTLSQDNINWEPPEIDSALRQMVPEEEMNTLRWIRLRIPSSIPQEVFDNIYCSLNCFPVVNRKLEDKKAWDSRARLNIYKIPLGLGEQFFDIESVRTEDGEILKQAQWPGLSDSEAGYYYLKTSGFGRLEQRDTAEMLYNLQEQMRDDFHAFSVYHTSILSQEKLENIRKLARAWQEGLGNKKALFEIEPYLVAHPTQEDAEVWVRYWYTHGELAEELTGIHQTSRAPAYIFQEATKMLSLPEGGRNRLSRSQRLSAFQCAMLGRDRIVTQKDIIFACRDFLGKEQIQKIQVKKALEASENPSEGFVRIIKVEIYLKVDRQNLSDWLKRAAQLQLRLNEYSSGFYPIHIQLKSAKIPVYE